MSFLSTFLPYGLLLPYSNVDTTSDPFIPFLSAFTEWKVFLLLLNSLLSSHHFQLYFPISFHFALTYFLPCCFSYPCTFHERAKKNSTVKKFLTLFVIPKIVSQKPFLIWFPSSMLAVLQSCFLIIPLHSAFPCI